MSAANGRTGRQIRLEGVRVHNLQNIDLAIPLRRLVVLTGVSGSGKSSLAFDTLYAEGQRRYLDSFSPYTRQFLDPLARPDADRIEHLPPVIAVRQQFGAGGSRGIVATATEIHDYLRLLFARAGQIVCSECGRLVQNDTPESVWAACQTAAEGARLQICFPLEAAGEDDGPSARLARLRADGYRRVVAEDATHELDGEPPETDRLWVIVDRLTAGTTSESRALDSIEQAFRAGDDRALLLVQGHDPGRENVTIDGRPWTVLRFNRRLVCEACGWEYLPPEPPLFSFHSPAGACATCEGFGRVPAIRFEKLVPDPSKSLREGAIAAWTTPAYRHELDELLTLADDYGVPVDVPFSELDERQLALIREGVPEREFGGLAGFFQWLERHKYKIGVRVFLNRWRDWQPCPDCGGDRLRPEALAVKIDGRSIADVCRETIDDAAAWTERLWRRLPDRDARLTQTIRPQIDARLRYLAEVGLGYLTLARPLATLSGGESRRVALTAALGSHLVNTLYVLDEPSAGLHPRDSSRVIEALLRLRDAGNSLIVVEHEPEFVKTADHVIDLGPGAGREGGRVVCQGTVPELLAAEEGRSVTADWLSGRQTHVRGSAPRGPQGWLTLAGARRHNLKHLTVRFPLGVLCAVTGVSGSGKSSLVEETLYPALNQRLATSGEGSSSTDADWDALDGAEQVDEVILVDQSPVGRSSRSNPVTYLKAFDEIRRTFAGTSDAKGKGFNPTHFSFNAAAGGRCPNCLGQGVIEIDMQFLTDVSMPCPECHGTRYRAEILEVKYRGRTIADALAMTANEAFTFFRAQRQVQRRLGFLKEVGLGYLPLGQPAGTLSGGEAQRLKLAYHLALGSKQHTLFLFDEPTTGLHPADVARLLDCFRQLVEVGHSLIVIEHNLDLIAASDYVIDLGPGAGEAGGEIVASGPPIEIAASEKSITGQYLAAHARKCEAGLFISR